MKFYKSLELLPIINYHLLQESIKKNTPEYRYLLIFDVKGPLPEYKNKDDLCTLKELYNSLMNEVKGLDLSILENYANLRYETDLIKIEFERNQIRKLQNIEELAIKFDKANNLFGEYLKALDNDFEDFEIVEYFIPNFRGNFEKHYNLKYKEEYNIIKNLRFYVFDELKAFGKSQSPAINKILNSRLFQTKFISSHKITIPKLQILADHLRDFFTKTNNFNYWVLYRVYYFDLTQLKCKPKKQNDLTILDELIYLAKITGIQLDKYNNSVKELFALRKVVEEEVQQSKKNKDKLKL